MAAPRFWSEIEAFRDMYTRRQALPWTHAVNHRLGVLITLLLRRTPITPNMVTVAGLILYMPITLLVASLKSPVGAGPAVVVLLGWQLAFSLDCADASWRACAAAALRLAPDWTRCSTSSDTSRLSPRW